MVTFRDFQNEFEDLQLFVENDEEADRLEHIAGYVPIPRVLMRFLGWHVSNKQQPQSTWKGRAKEEEYSSRYVTNSRCLQGNPC